MALHVADPLETRDAAAPAARRPRPVLRPRRRLTVEGLAWAVLVLLSFGPLIGWLLATLL